MRTSHLVLCTALAGVAAVGAQAILQQPRLAASRRPLTPGEVHRLAAAGPAAAQFHANFFAGVGVSSKLNSKQLDYFRDRGTHEIFLLRYLAEHGVTPEESEALAAEGVDMALADPTQMHVFHWAALSDLVIAGQVDEVRGNPAGPYHTEIDMRVERHLKDATGRRAARVTGVLLRTGPRLDVAEGDIHEVKAMDEPDLKEGERVVLFLSRQPLNLLSLLGSTLANAGALSRSFERDYGTLDALHKVLAAPTEFEVLTAYKIVQDKAVLKCDAYRVPTPYDVIDLAELTARVERIAAAQGRHGSAGR